LATRGSSSAKLDWNVEVQSIELARTASRDFLKSNRREILDFVFILFSFQEKEVIVGLGPMAKDPRKY
jgi:hypothetical protein